MLVFVQKNLDCPEPPAQLVIENDRITANDVSMALGSFINSQYGEMLDFEGKRGLYSRIKQQESEMLGINNTIDQFYTTASNTIEDFYQIGQSVDGVLSSSQCPFE